MDYFSLAADIPVRLMAENRQWPNELPNTIRKGQERLLEGLHPDALRQEFDGRIDLVLSDDEDETIIEGLIDLTEVDHFGEIISIRLLSGATLRTLLPRSFDFCAALFGTLEERTGNDPVVPKYYAEKIPGLYATFPRPSTDFTFKGIANLRCPLIAPDGPATNLLTDHHATLLEYACAVEGAIWMKDNSAAQIWEAAYTAKLKSTNDNIRRRRRDETTVAQRSTENTAGAP